MKTTGMIRKLTVLELALILAVSFLGALAESDPSASRSFQSTTSARMKPRSKSEWIFPAACGAFVPFLMVQARVSFSPAVR